jgi:hypothetical protein
MAKKIPFSLKYSVVPTTADYFVKGEPVNVGWMRFVQRAAFVIWNGRAGFMHLTKGRDEPYYYYATAINPYSNVCYNWPYGFVLYEGERPMLVITGGSPLGRTELYIEGYDVFVGQKPLEYDR